ncbi:unnamed protein product [Prunus armeniaca]
MDKEHRSHDFVWVNDNLRNISLYGNSPTSEGFLDEGRFVGTLVKVNVNPYRRRREGSMRYSNLLEHFQQLGLGAGWGEFGAFWRFQQQKGVRAGGGGQQPGLARGGVRPEHLPAG